jgi:hypothetical protein
MYMSGMKGKCLDMLHVYQDSLFALGDTSIQLPLVQPPARVPQPEETKEDVESVQVEVPEQIDSKTPAADQPSEINELVSDLKINPEKVDKEAEDNGEEPKQDSVDHEKILTDAFLIAVKYKSKEFKLPIIVSTFMKTMQTCW